jgi:hypothetical protein
MRVRVARHIAELPGDAWRGRVSQVEDERLPAGEAVGEELRVGGEFVLGVVRPVPASRDRERRDQAPVAHGVLGDIEHRQEVGLRRVAGGSPEVEILRGRRRRRRRRGLLGRG